jgi:flagellar protein FlaF
MGFETSVVVAIFLIAFLFLGGTYYNGWAASQDNLQTAKEDNNALMLDKTHTSISIEEINFIGPKKSYTITVDVTNTGISVLDCEKINILVDGKLTDYDTPTDPHTWSPEESVTFTMDDLKGSGLHRIKVVTENGIGDYATYHID